MKNKIAFLFGAGLSDPEEKLGISTKILTDKILLGEKFKQHMNGDCFYDNEMLYNWNGSKEYIERIKQFMLKVKDDFSDYHNQEMNYEDYYYYINSMNSEGDFFDEFNYYFLQNKLHEYHYLLKPVGNIGQSLTFSELVLKSLNYIRCVITHFLDINPSDYSHLEFLKKVYNDSDFKKSYIFSLNHDTFIEKFFDKNSIEFNDGFIKRKNEYVWQANSYNTRRKIDLFKLHGSIDWYNNMLSGYKKKVYKQYSEQRGAAKQPFLSGGLNKLYEYNYGINFELQYLFWKYLNECDRLIVSGYSFGDQGINSRIINWLYKSRKRKMIIIHKDVDNMLKYVRPAIINNWQDWTENDIVRIIPKWIQDTNWEEMKTFFE